MIFTCYSSKEDTVSSWICKICSYALIPSTAVFSFIFNSLTLFTLLRVCIPAFERKPIEFLAISNIMACLCVLVALYFGYPGVVLHSCFTSLAAYILFFIIIGRWFHLNLPSYSSKMSSATAQYICFAVCSLWVIVPSVYLFFGSVYDPATATWAQDTKGDGVIFFWYLHRFLPELLILFFVLKLKFETIEFPQEEKAVYLVQCLGTAYLVSNIPSLVRGTFIPLKRTEWLYAFEVFVESMSSSLLFFLLYNFNVFFRLKVQHQLTSVSKALKKNKTQKKKYRCSDKSSYEKGFSVNMDTSEVNSIVPLEEFERRNESNEVTHATE